MIIPGAMVSSIGDPSLVPTLLELKEESGPQPIVLVIEDGDMAMTQRAADNMSAISALLNASSGIVGDLMDLRIIATTNAKKPQLEKALLRKGRLSAVVEVGPLSDMRANRVFERLTGDKKEKYHSSASLANVYADAREAGWVPPTKPDDEKPKKIRKRRRRNFTKGGIEVDSFLGGQNG